MKGDFMRSWFESVYSDGTRGFVSNPEPNLSDEVEITIRVLNTDEINDVILWRITNEA